MSPSRIIATVTRCPGIGAGAASRNGAVSMKGGRCATRIDGSVSSRPFMSRRVKQMLIRAPRTASSARSWKSAQQPTERRADCEASTVIHGTPWRRQRPGPIRSGDLW
uniref:hypothetical protein n=1 Tax=Mangrovicoccus ximenensis TaxID=1911570 RepID=UPI000D365FD8